MYSNHAHLVAFLVASTVVTLFPGPDFLLLMRNTVRGGRQSGLGTAAGTATGLALRSAAAALGLSQLLAASTLGYDALRFVGAGYMIWLGGSTLLCNGYPREHSATVVESLPARTWSTGFTTGYANGLLSDLCNPKVGIFYIAFLPSFIPTGADAREAALGLGLANAAETYAQMI